jgi:hypothetical protein
MGAVQRHRYGHVSPAERTETGTGKLREAGRRPHQYANSQPDYHFAVNNTDTEGKWSRHKEQKGSLTYYSLYQQQKIALGVEATKNCALAEAVSYLTIATNAAIEEAGIQAEALPSESSRSVGDLREARSKSPSKSKSKG